MLEAFVCRPRIDQISHCQLVNVTQALIEGGIYNSPFVGIEPYEDVNRVANLMDFRANRSQFLVIFSAATNFSLNYGRSSGNR